MCKIGMGTPWGIADHVENIGTVDGHTIYFVGTPSHGGFNVPQALLSRIRPEYRAWAEKWSGSDRWYEEDCCYAAVYVSFPELFPTDRVENAQRTINHYCKIDINADHAGLVAAG